MRVLLVHDDRNHRVLLQHHLQIAREDIAISEHVPGRDGPLPPEFVAAAFDVVLLSSTPAGASGLDWLANLRARPMFPPIVYLVPAPDATHEAQALEQGAFGVLPTRKIETRRLAELLGRAERERRAALQAFRLGPNSETPYRFGQTLIKGERCIRPIATSAMSTVYLAESEREGRLVVVKLMHQVPDMLALPSLRCLDFGQSHLNDVDAVYPQARARQIGLVRVRATREELTGGSIRRRFPAGATLLFEAGSLAEAQAAVAAYRNLG